MIWLLMSAALAMEPPERPEHTEPVKDQCPEAIPFREGDTAVCKGVLLPTSWVADYELMMAYSSKIEARYRVDTTALEKELYATQRLLEQAHKPVPFYEQKPFWTGVGIIIGGAAVVGGGYTILAVSKGD